MAVGDTKSAIASVAAAGFQDIQPAAGEEWIVTNIYHEGDVELQFFDGTSQLIFDSVVGKGVYAKFAFRVTNGIRIRVKNTMGAAKLCGYDAMQSK